MDTRRLVHLRQVECLAFERDDKLWDLEVSLTDRKGCTFLGAAGDRPAGMPIHAMSLVCTVDAAGNVLMAKAHMRDVPFEVTCRQVEQSYGELVGLNLFRRFRAELKNRLADRRGCHHLSMLADTLPTLAIQAFAGITAPIRDDGTSDVQPASLDRCGGLRTDGEAVRRYWPRWYRGSRSGAGPAL